MAAFPLRSCRKGDGEGSPAFSVDRLDVSGHRRSRPGFGPCSIFLTRWVKALPDLETAFYFSMVTFTTLGFGDVVLTGQWRTLASIQAANGVIIFGWTTGANPTYL